MQSIIFPNSDKKSLLNLILPIYQKVLFKDFVLTPPSLIVTNGKGIYFEDNLHENWKELYYHVFKLKVNSVFECGCGNAHHLINISKILPQAEIGGCDYKQSQIDLGYKYYNLDKYSIES